MEKELIHIQTRKSDKVLCGLPANMWLNAMLDAPVEDFCPQCLAEAQAHLTKRAADVCQSSPLGTHRFINDDAGEICIMCGTRR